jgi:hypothetical protein
MFSRRLGAHELRKIKNICTLSPPKIEALSSPNEIFKRTI